MDNLKKILLTTDLKKNTEYVIKAGVNIAKAHNAEILLLHVIPTVPGSPILPEAIQKKIKIELGKLKEEITNQGVIVSQTLLSCGLPFDRILRNANHYDVDLIVVGGGKKDAEDSLGIGITTGRLVQQSNKPLWIADQNSAGPVKKILCPVDFSGSSERVLRNAIEFARIFKAELEVLTIIWSWADLYPEIVSSGDKEQKAFEAESKTKFEEFLKKFNFDNVKWKKAIQLGKPQEKILKTAIKEKVDLIAMGSVGATHHSRIPVGRVATKLFRTLPCSIFTLKSEAAFQKQTEEEIESIKGHLKEGQELLAKGLPAQAMHEFELCVAKNLMYVPAWEGLANAHEQLGEKKEATQCHNKAKHINQVLSKPDRKIEASIRQGWRRQGF